MKYNMALIQSAVTDSKERNLINAERLVRSAAESGADIAVLPEMFICPYDNGCFPVYAEPADGPSIERLSRLAGETGMYFIAGSVPEAGESGQIYNSSFSFSPEGRIIGKHRKIHLFDIDISGGVSFRESDTLTGGETPTLIQTPWGSIGVAICFDIRFA